jgi:phosphoglucomutase
MAPGFSALNHLTVVQLSHGLANYLKEVKPNKELSIVIGYDGRFLFNNLNFKRVYKFSIQDILGRHRSEFFAKDAASVFIRNGINVHLFSKVVPTPVVSFATPVLNCDAGL